MSTQTHKIRLTSCAGYGTHVPPEPVAAVLASMPRLTRRAVRMAFQGTSSVSGKRPAWLSRASDIRFAGMDGTDDTILYFEAPQLGEAAEELYGQGELWNTRPAPELTAFDLLGGVVRDVRDKNSDSDRFDGKMLDAMYYLRHGLEKGFDQLTLYGSQNAASTIAIVDAGVLTAARNLRRITPAPRQVRITGTLDMIRASTQTFAVDLDSGETVRGTFFTGEIESLSEFFKRRVTVMGKAVFRPSGHVLRVDAEEVIAADGHDCFFSQMPVAVPRKISAEHLAKSQPRKGGIAAIFGKWPGDETDEEIAEALRLIS